MLAGKKKGEGSPRGHYTVMETKSVGRIHAVPTLHRIITLVPGGVSMPENLGIDLYSIPRASRFPSVSCIEKSLPPPPIPPYWL
jgi:hypothetical protein